MERILSQIPKPILAIAVITAGVILFLLISPPHTICDTYKQSLEEEVQGLLSPRKVQKKTFPPKVNEQEEQCRLGNSSGACHDYFTTLRTVARKIREFPEECASEVLSVNNVRPTIEQGLEKMVRMAWGDKPPEVGLSITGWLQESELSVFCQVQDVYRRARGEQGLKEFRDKVFSKLPGPLPKGYVNPTEPPPAVEVMEKGDIWKRSLFSVNCRLFL